MTSLMDALVYLLKVDSATHGVDDGLWLLEDLLLHEGGVVALHDLLDLHLQGGHFPVQRTVVVQAARRSVNGKNTWKKTKTHFLTTKHTIKENVNLKPKLMRLD